MPRSLAVNFSIILSYRFVLLGSNVGRYIEQPHMSLYSPAFQRDLVLILRSVDIGHRTPIITPQPSVGAIRHIDAAQLAHYLSQGRLTGRSSNLTVPFILIKL